MSSTYLKKLGRTTALVAAFALTAGIGQQAMAQDNSPFADVQHRLASVEDIAKQIQMTKHTQEVLGLPANPAEIAELKASLKKGADLNAPRIILTLGLTAPQQQSLIDEFAEKVGPLPDYLAKVNHKTKLIGVCTEELVPADDTYTVALATSIANCVAAKKTVEAAPVAATPAPVVPVAETPAPVKEPVKVDAPAPVKTEAPAPVTAPKPVTEAKASGFNPLSPVNLGIEFGGAALLLGGGLVFLRRKKSDGTAPQAPAPEKAPAANVIVDDTPAKKSKPFNL